MTEDFVLPHPSGVGFYLVPPVGVPFRIRRSDVRANDGVILAGQIGEYRRYLDFDAPASKDVTYTLESPAGRGTRTVRVEPQLSYSAVNDAEEMDAPNPRDALVVYYATRLAQLVRAGRLTVFAPAGETETNHARRYPVRSQFHFDEAEVPGIALEYEGGGAQALDLGHTMSEVTFAVQGECIARSREERDSLRQAITGLWKDTEWFLEDVGCIEAELVNLRNGYQADEPVMFTLSFTIQGVFTVVQRGPDQRWEMLPSTIWV